MMLLLLLTSRVLLSLTVFVLLFPVATLSRNIYIERNYTRIKLDPKTTRFTAQEKWKILQIHNSYRSLVEPPARDMRELKWDDDLEQFAWNHTQFCTGAHSERNMVKVWPTGVEEKWDSMGENLYYAPAPTYSIDRAVNLFWIEGQYYNIKDDSCVPGNTCGHYQIVVGASSSRIGCALNTCKKFSVSGFGTPAIFMSCNYDGAYYTAKKPYTVGTRGADCNAEKQYSSFRYCRHGLCTSADFVFTNTGFNGDTSIVGMQPVGSPCGDNTPPTIAGQPTNLGPTAPGPTAPGPTAPGPTTKKSLDPELKVTGPTTEKRPKDLANMKSTTPRASRQRTSEVVAVGHNAKSSNASSKLSESIFQRLHVVVCLLVILV